jgi:uncharacterized membrane protein HdeD (DUF308 family)
MQDDEVGPPAALVAASTWQATLFIGVLTLILGIIVTIHPSGSLSVIAVLLGVLAVISGLFHLIRMFDRAEQHRIWQGIAGLLFIVVGVLLIRHLDLTVAAIGLLVGISWIVQGVASIIAAFSGPRQGRAWWAVFGVISVIAGIVVTASPVTSVTVLAVLLGIWFIIMGVFEISLAFIIRHALSAASSQAGPRTPEGSADEGAGAR